jgi:hypothetical protein
MFAPDGYSSLFKAFTYSRATIVNLINARRHEVGPSVSGERSDPSILNSNIEAAAKLLVCDIINVKWIENTKKASKKVVCVYRTDGSITKLTPSILTPRIRHNPSSEYLQALKEVQNQDPSFRIKSGFGLHFLKVDFWLDFFHTTNLFESYRLTLNGFAVKPIENFGVIDWNHGTISTENLRLAAQAFEVFAVATGQLTNLGIEIPRSVQAATLKDFKIPTKAVRLLEPLNGCPVLIPDEWLVDIQQSRKDTRSSSQFHQGPPRDRILSILSEEPNLTKSEVREQHFPEFSVRKFAIHWQQATEIRPEISSPGRRRRAKP